MYMPSIFGESLFDNMFPFDEKFFTEKKDPLYGKNVSRLMKTDVRETEKTYELDIDLPGFKKDEIQIELKDGYLTVSAEKGLDKDEEDKKGKYIRKERYAGALSRTFFSSSFGIDTLRIPFSNFALISSSRISSPR